jgi:hypothetical protein
MRMLRVALVLFVLASFVAATAAVSMAATVTPTVKPTMKPVASMMPTKKPGKMIDLAQMKSTIGDTYKKLVSGTKMPGASAVPGRVARGGNATQTASTGTSPMNKTAAAKPSKSLTTSDMRAMPAVQQMNQLVALPKMGGTSAKIGSAPGENLMIGLSV